MKPTDSVPGWMPTLFRSFLDFFRCFLLISGRYGVTITFDASICIVFYRMKQPTFIILLLILINCFIMRSFFILLSMIKNILRDYSVKNPYSFVRDRINEKAHYATDQKRFFRGFLKYVGDVLWLVIEFRPFFSFFLWVDVTINPFK